MNYKYFILFIISIILIACAQVVPLSGGEKDIDPPKEVESFPKNGSTNFNSDEIVIEFDEFIQTQNLSSQLIISPLMSNPPNVTVKNKKLIIKLQDTLLPNTTYSLNFGEAIQDITENNPIPNFKYVFSTGNFIDSLSFSGIVVNAEDLTPQEKVYVLLYNQFEDSVPLKEKPRYVSLSDKDGKFNITNIAHGTYKLFALKDINNNYLYDLPNEEIAFSDTLITINSISDNNLLSLFEEDNNVQFILKSEHKKYGEFDLILNKPSIKIDIKPLSNNLNSDWAIFDYNESNDTIKFWSKKNINLEELIIEVSDKNEVIDTLSFNLIPKKKFIDTNLIITSNVRSSFDLNKNINLQLNRPFKSFYGDSIKLYKDSIDISSTLLVEKTSIRTIGLKYNFEENTNYKLVVPASTFEDIYGMKNDTSNYLFTTKKITDYGNINLNITPHFKDKYIVRLTKNNQIIRTDFLNGNTTLKYNYLSPGNYGLVLIIDKNNDQKWTTGNYLNKQQPETVIFYEKPIVIKANWDNDISWTIKD